MSNNLRQNIFFQIAIQSIPIVVLITLIFFGYADMGIAASAISMIVIRRIFKKNLNDQFSVTKKHVLSFVMIGWLIVFLGSIAYVYFFEENSGFIKSINDAFAYYIYPFIFIFGLLMGVPFALYLFFRNKELKNKK